MHDSSSFSDDRFDGLERRESAYPLHENLARIVTHLLLKRPFETLAIGGTDTKDVNV